MASLTRWTWVWVNSGSWWWTGRPSMLRFMVLQRVGHDWAIELNWIDGQFQSVVLRPACKFSENVSDLKSHYKPVYHWSQFLLSKKSSAHETKVPEADRPLLLPCSSPPLPTVAATAHAPTSPIEKATTYPSYSVLFYYSWQILSTTLCSQPTRVQVPAHPSGTCCPSSVRCEAFKRKITISLSTFQSWA